MNKTFCDKCGVEIKDCSYFSANFSQKHSVKPVITEADLTIVIGWDLSKTFDFCRSCMKEITKRKEGFVVFNNRSKQNTKTSLLKL